MAKLSHITIGYVSNYRTEPRGEDPVRVLADPNHLRVLDAPVRVRLPGDAVRRRGGPRVDHPQPLVSV